MTPKARGCLSRLSLILLGIAGVAGCNYEGVFFPMDVDVAATDSEGNPTELFITDLGDSLPCTSTQDSAIYRVDTSQSNYRANLLWQFDKDEPFLNGAHNADLNDSGNQMIISDNCNDRVIVISYPDKALLWDSSVDCPELGLDHPNDANFLGEGIGNGNLLITVRDLHWVIEVDPSQCNGVRDGEIVWSLGEEGVPRNLGDMTNPDHLRSPHNADKLPNGNLILSDSGSVIFGPSRIILVDYSTKEILWNFRARDNSGSSLYDCTVEGIPDKLCPAAEWCRDADMKCDNPACRTGQVIITGVHQTVAVLLDLDEPPPPGESIPRGRTVVHKIEHGPGFCYDTDWIPKWAGDENGGLGFYLVGNHGPGDFGRFVIVAPVDAEDLSFVWLLKLLQ